MKTYSASEHSFSFAGLACESGRGTDEFMSWEQKEPDISVKTGIDGESTVSESVVDYTELTLTIMQTSEYNAKLTALRLLKVTAPIFVRDRQGTTMIASATARIMGPPAQKRGKEVGLCEWKFSIFNPTRFDGGT